MTFTSALPPGLHPAAMPVPAPSWTRPPAEKTAPAQETQRDRERQQSGRDTLSRVQDATDTVSLSREARRLIAARDSGEGNGGGGAAASSAKTGDRVGDSAEDQTRLQELEARDAEVHEQNRTGVATSSGATGTAGARPLRSTLASLFEPAAHAYDAAQGYGTTPPERLDLLA